VLVGAGVDTMAYFSVALGGGGRADRVRPSSRSAWQISENHCPVAYCSRGHDRERRDDGSVLARERFGHVARCVST